VARTFISTVAVVCALAGGTAHAYGKWVLVDEGTANYWDFSVGKGKFCWVDYAGAPYYYAGSTGCATGTPQGGTVDRVSDFSKANTFPNGHAQRIAVGEKAPTESAPSILATTAEGYLWLYEKVPNSKATVRWLKGPALPSTLPIGMGTCTQYGCSGGYGVTRLVYEAVNFYTGRAATNPVWILGSDSHVYRLVGAGLGTAWADVSQNYGLGPIAQLSYSGLYEAMVVTWANGMSAYYDDSLDGWYYTTSSAPTAPVAIDNSFSEYFGRNFYAAGGFYESSCNSHLSDGSCSYTFQLGFDTWDDLDTLPTPVGQAQIFSDQIDEAWQSTANANLPDEEIPINMAEGSFDQDSAQYGGGPNDLAQDYQDLLWVQTSKLRVYVYEIWLAENR
jgi:hypothetical protein